MAAISSRVGTLLVEPDRAVPGGFDRTPGQSLLRSGRSHVDHTLGDLAELAFAKGGEVVVIPTQRMPRIETATIFRF